MRRGRAPGFAAACAVALALAGCAGSRARPPAGAAVPPPPAATGATSPADTAAGAPAPRPGPVTAPWDTAANAHAARLAHVYPQGESPLGKRLVASLPDPGGLAPREGGPPPASPAPGSACWQAQLVATADRARAERDRDEAAALLGVAVTIVTADGVHRVRAGGCLDADAALRLVERARAEGWREAFRVPGGP